MIKLYTFMVETYKVSIRVFFRILAINLGFLLLLPWSSRNSVRDTVVHFLSTSHICVHSTTGHLRSSSYPSWELNSLFSSLPDSALVSFLGPE